MTIDPLSSDHSLSDDPDLAKDGFLRSDFNFDTMEISMKDYLFAAKAGTQRNREAVFDNQQQDALFSLKQFQSFVEKAANFALIQSAITAQWQAWQNLYNLETSMQARINTYNSTDKNTLASARTNLQNAINTYNSIVPATTQSTQNLNNAITTYLNIVNPILSSYNGQANAQNAAVANLASLNSTATSLGMPTLVGTNAQLVSAQTSFTIVSPPGMPAVAPISPSGNVSNILISQAPPTLAAAITLYSIGVLADIINTIIVSFSQMLLITAFTASLSDINLKAVGEAAAFIQSQHPVFLNASQSIPSGTGPSVGASVAGTTNPSLFQRIVNQAVYSPILYEGATRLSTTVSDQLKSFVLAILSEVAVQAGNRVSQNLSDASISPKGLPLYFDVQSALSFAESIQGLIDSGTISSGVRKILNGNEELNSLSESEKQEMVSAITGPINLALGQIALSQVALALKAPGLIAQVFGNVDEVQRQGLSNIQNSSSDVFNEVLNNPLTIIALKTALANILVSSGGSSSTGQSTQVSTSTSSTASSSDVDQSASQVNAAVNSVLATGNIPDETAFRLSFTNALLTQGLTTNQANTLVDKAISFVKNEAKVPILNLPIESLKPIETLINEIDKQQGQKVATVLELPEALKALAPVGTLQRENLLRLFIEGLRNSAFVDALRSAVAQAPTNLREFQRLILDQLLAGSADAALAQRFASVAGNASAALAEYLASTTVSILAPFPTDNPLLNKRPEIVLTRDQLLELLTKHVGDLLKPVAGAGVGYIENVTATTITKILNTLNDNIRDIKQRSDEDALKGFILNVKELSRVDLQQYLAKFALTNAIKTQVEVVRSWMIPSEQVDLRKSQETPFGPGTHKRNLDFTV